MMRIGIIGYGNLGKRVESALAARSDMELGAIFTRGDISEMRPRMRHVPLRPLEDAFEMTDSIDVMINCCSSASDLPETMPRFAERFHLIDSYDACANHDGYFEKVDQAARRGNRLSIISAGSDPGMYSFAMPNFFSDDDAIVHLITQEQVANDYRGLPRGGFMIHRGNAGWSGMNKQTIEYSLRLSSNPEFMAGVLISTARAAYRLGNRGETGCRTVFNLVPAACL
jgi:hypothetical protein